MPTTTRGYPYPSGTDDPNGPLQIQALAEAIDADVTSLPTGGGGAVGGGTDKVFYENDKVITTNYTITTGKNAMTAGPVTINSGVTVTVPSGSTWVVV